MDAIITLCVALYFVYTFKPTNSEKEISREILGVWKTTSSLEKNERAFMKIYERLIG